MASSYYVSHTTPKPEPMVFTETTRNNLRRVHKVSGQAVRVTSATTGMIHKFIDKTVDRVSTPRPSSQQTPASPSTPGLLPYGQSPGRSSPAPKPKTRLLNRLLMSTDLILTTLENSAQTLVAHTTESLAASLGHTYGGEMAGAVRTIGSAVRNVGVVYIDYRGVGRRVLIRRVGKRMLKGRVGQREVIIGGEGIPDVGAQPQPQPPSQNPPAYEAPSQSSGKWRYQDKSTGSSSGGNNVEFKS